MATREKQIEEMAQIMDDYCAENAGSYECDKKGCFKCRAESLYNAGCRKIVLCDDCYLQGHCIVEDTFNTARMADSMKFCAVGKPKTDNTRTPKERGGEK
jgi:hypothetical protein